MRSTEAAARAARAAAMKYALVRAGTAPEFSRAASSALRADSL